MNTVYAPITAITNNVIGDAWIPIDSSNPDYEYWKARNSANSAKKHLPGQHDQDTHGNRTGISDYITSDEPPNNATFIDALGGRPTEDTNYLYHVTQSTNIDSIKEHGLNPGKISNFPGYVTKYVALAYTATQDNRGPKFVGGAGYYGVIIMHQDWSANNGKFRRPVMLRVAKSSASVDASWRDDEVAAKHVAPEHLEYWDAGSWKSLTDNTIAEKQLPITEASKARLIDVRISLFQEDSDRLAESMYTGNISIGQWEEQMKKLIRELHSSVAAVGKGGWDQMTNEDWGHIGPQVKNQYRYLHGFAEWIDENKETATLNAIQARARMYGNASRNSAYTIQAGKELSKLLPWLPGDGSTECLVNCKCRWELEIVGGNKNFNTVQAVWKLGAAEHCDDCIDRNGYVHVMDVNKDVNIPAVIGGY